MCACDRSVVQTRIDVWEEVLARFRTQLVTLYETHLRRPGPTGRRTDPGPPGRACLEGGASDYAQRDDAPDLRW
ncbi:hypothetical protein RS3R2_44830 [Pseudomonas lactis]|nr:hypothetical protein RS3R2_44830 [Pseudomonas lactis]